MLIQIRDYVYLKKTSLVLNYTKKGKTIGVETISMEVIYWEVYLIFNYLIHIISSKISFFLSLFNYSSDYISFY